MKIGMNMLLWTTSITEEHFPYFETLKGVGFDGIEIPIFDTDVGHYKTVGKRLSDLGLGCTAVSVIPDEAHNPISPNADHRQAAIDQLRQTIDCCAAAGVEILVGPLYQPLGVFSGSGPTEAEKESAAEVLRAVAVHAQDAKVEIGLENLNRFECYFLTTLDDAAALADRVAQPALGIMYDTFHANIEEKDPVACITKHMDKIRHVHISANDRGTPGKGHIPWAETFRALRAGGYDRWLTIEAFGRSLPDLAAATKIWRDNAASPEEVYEEGFRLIKEGWEAAG